jgi:hypothetical protein
MASRHLSCAACRIRVRANAPAIAVLENRCPLCGAALGAVSSAADVIGFRSFDLDEFSQQESGDRAHPSLHPDDLLARRHAASSQDALDGHRWEDDGGSVIDAAAVAVEVAVGARSGTRH